MAGILKQIDQSLDQSFDAGKRYARNALGYFLLFVIISAVASLLIMASLGLFVSIGSSLLINAGWAVMSVKQAALASVVGSIVTFGALAGFQGLYQVYRGSADKKTAENTVNTILFAGMAGIFLGPLVTMAGMAVLGMGGAQTMSFLASSLFIGGGFIVGVPLVIGLIAGLAVMHFHKSEDHLSLLIDDDDNLDSPPQQKSQPSVRNNGSSQDENDKNGPVLHAFENQKQSDKSDGKKNNHESEPVVESKTQIKVSSMTPLRGH